MPRIPVALAVLVAALAPPTAALATPGGAEGGTGATWVVTSTADAPAAGSTIDGVCESTLPDGACTLRAAISEANFGTDDVVQVPAGTYTLSVAGEGEDANATGDLDVTQPQTIQGAPGAVIDAGGFQHAVQIFADTATLDGLTIRGASGSGVDLFAADGVVTDTTITDNAIGLTVRNSFNDATRRSLVLDEVAVVANTGVGLSSAVSNNTAPLDLSATATAFDANNVGLTLSTASVCTCVDVTVEDNASHGVSTGTLLGDRMTIVDNGGTGVSGATVSLHDSVVSGNAAGIGSPQLTLVASTVSDNDGVGAGRSDSNFSDPITGLVIDSTIAGNAGVGLLAHIERDNIDATTEGAQLAVLGSTVIGNGGAGVRGDELEVFNSTITGNGGRGVDPIRRPYGASIDHSTVVGNGATGAAGNVANVRRLANSIIGAPAGGTDCRITDGPVRSFGYNVVSDESCRLVVNDHSLDGTDAEGVGTAGLHLGPPRDNGGPTLTLFPLAGSPALDRQPAAGCAGADQRGVPRPFGAGCDSGAVEAVFEPVAFPDVTPTATHQAGVRWTTREQILPGYPDGTWRPTKLVLRKHLIVALWQLAGAPTEAPPHPFTDVPPTAPYTDALDWAAANHLLTGTRAKPNETVTRGRLATQLWVLATTPDAWTTPPPPTVPFAPAP